MKSLFLTTFFVLFTSNIFSIELTKDIHYKVVGKKKSKTPKIEVFFNYGCKACYASEILVKQLAKEKSKDTLLIQVPVAVFPDWKTYVEAYHIADMLGVLDKLHDSLYYRVHVENKPIKNKSELKDFFKSLKVDLKKFDQIVSSMELSTRVNQSNLDAIKRKVTGTPSYVVNEYYLINKREFNDINELKAAIFELAKR